jgi:hypothetical protein
MKVTKSACSSSNPCSGFGDSSGCISSSQLKSVGIGSHKLQTDAANAFIKMYSDMPDNIKGSVKLSDSYRPLNVQCNIFDFDHYEKTGKKRKKGTSNTAAAYPGSSNHGWGRAIDISPSNVQNWIKENGEKYGWTWGEGRAVGEPWHFTFCGSGPNRDKNCDKYMSGKITVDTTNTNTTTTNTTDTKDEKKKFDPFFAPLDAIVSLGKGDIKGLENSINSASSIIGLSEDIDRIKDIIKKVL